MKRQEKFVVNLSSLISKSLLVIVCFFCLTSCITWVRSELDPPSATEFRAAQGDSTLTVSFRQKNIDYSKMTKESLAWYGPHAQRWMQPGVDLIKEHGVFRNVESTGLEIRKTGRHLAIQFEEDSGVWTMTNAVIAGLTLNWFPTYAQPDNVYYVTYYENGSVRKQYEYRFTFHSLNWNLFLPFWLFRSNQDTMDRNVALLFQHIVGDLLRDEII